MRRLPVLLLSLFATGTVHAQSVLSGVIRDSLAHRVIAHATVQIVSADPMARFGRGVIADSLGRFAFDDLPIGRYILGFYHPALDSIGVEAPLREVVVTGRDSMHVNLSTPSPAQMRFAVCGPDTTGTALIIGIVRAAQDRAAALDVAVVGEWLDVTISRQGVAPSMQRRTATTGANGWFALCALPNRGTVLITASRGADSTDRVELLIPPNGFARHDFYLGATRSGRLSGIVVRTETGVPLPGAQVGIMNGPQTHADERGSWTLLGAPLGTRMLEVRAFGYYPERRRIDVVAGAPPIEISLMTLKAVLDTMRVSVSRIQRPDLDHFASRVRYGTGKYITAADIARQRPIVTTDLLRMVSSLRFDPNRGESPIRMRGGMGRFDNTCLPAIYVDGVHLPGIIADEIDGVVRARDLVGIEIYTEATLPGAFQRPMEDCGAILIWRR